MKARASITSEGRSARRGHPVAVAVFLVLAGLLLLFGGAALYANRELADSDRFADRVASTLRDEDVRAVIVRRVVAAIESGRPDLIAARPVITRATAAAAAGAPFAAAVRAAARQLHASVFDRDRRTASLEVADAGVLVVDAVRRLRPELARRLPPSVETQVASLVTLHRSATAVAEPIERLGPAGVAALVLAALALAAALLLAADRRRALVAAGLTVAAVGALGAAALAVGRAIVASYENGGRDGDAARAVWDAFLGGLSGWYLAALACGLIVAAAAAAWRALSRPRAEPVPGPAPRDSAPGSRRARSVAALAVVAGLVVAAALVARSVATPPGPIRAGHACNGHRELCDRRLDEVALAATHNSMAAASEPGWFFAQQQKGITAQLEYGIRGLLIDTHYGVRTPRGVATDLEAEGSTRAKLVAEVGEAFVRAAERLRGRIGYTGDAAPELFLCHGACEVGATPLDQALGEIRDFAVKHPREVIVLSIQDAVTPADTVKAFEKAGLLPLVYDGPSGPPWPTLGELIDSGHRIVVFAENHGGEPPWYRPQFDLVQETPFGFRSVAALEEPRSCDPNRGPNDAKLFLLNHWVDTPPANKPSNARTVNAYDALLARARRCEKRRDRLPNLLAIDFYESGDVLGVADTLNGLAASR